MMEQFLSDIHFSLFVHYIHSCLKDSTIKEDRFGTLIKTEKLNSTIFFTKDKIVEFSVEEDSKVIYYLHFEFIQLSNALHLFHDYLTYLLNNQPKKVLICCSSAMTSSYIVDGLTKYIKDTHKNITVEACSYHYIDKAKEHYDLILLAPQISYLFCRLPKTMNCQIIPATVYATSDYEAIINMILKENQQIEVD